MKIALYILGALFAGIVVIGIIGALLPRRHTATRQAVFHQKTAALYAVVSNWAAQTSWRSGLQSVEMLAPQDGRVRYRELSKHGAITFLVVENESDRKLVTKIADEQLPYGGTWTYEFTEGPEGACLRITEDGEVKNPFFRFFARFVFGYTSNLEAYLRDLGTKFGETVQVQE